MKQCFIILELKPKFEDAKFGVGALDGLNTQVGNGLTDVLLGINMLPKGMHFHLHCPQQ